MTASQSKMVKIVNIYFKSQPRNLNYINCSQYTSKRCISILFVLQKLKC